MKVVNSIGGTAAVRIVSDEVMPRPGFLQRNMIDFVGHLCRFSVRPSLPPSMPSMPVLQFQAGEMVHKNERIVIQQLIIFPDGDAVVAQDTDLADRALETILVSLDEKFEFRYGGAKLERLYSSALAVELDEKFVERTSAFSLMRTAANDAAGRSAAQYRLKRIAFGESADPDLSPIQLVGQFAASDFSLERRVAVPFERNLFFSSAPLRTQDHIAYLERVEREILAI